MFKPLGMIFGAFGFCHCGNPWCSPKAECQMQGCPIQKYLKSEEGKKENHQVEENITVWSLFLLVQVNSLLI